MSRPFKYFDRVLNVILVIVALLWAYQHFIGKPPRDLRSEAQSEFGVKDIPGDLSTQAQSEFEAKPNLPAQSVTYSDQEIVPIDFDKIDKILKESDVPVALFIYTSWCPYCNKLFPEIAQIAREQDGMVKVLAVSVDEDPEQYKRYMASKSSPLPFDAYHLGDGPDYARLTNYLQLIGFRFTGGIPFIAFFSHNKPAGQIGGYVEKYKIEEMLQKVYLKHEESSLNSHSKPTL